MIRFSKIFAFTTEGLTLQYLVSSTIVAFLYHAWKLRVPRLVVDYIRWAHADGSTISVAKLWRSIWICAGLRITTRLSFPAKHKHSHM